MRGSVLTIDGGTYKDDGAGNFKFVSGADNFSQITLSYESGQIDAYRKTSVFTSGAQLAYTPAARLIGAEEALSLGLVSELLDTPEALLERASAMDEGSSWRNT